ncbi:MAG: FHA domain-containing protein, partial [Planctomycetota bacterium]
MTANAPSSPPPAYLVVRQANRWTDVFRLREKRHVRIGRSSTCQIVVRSDQASREHAEIFPSAGRWVLRDRGSRNGTRVRPANPSEHQDRLQGDHVLTEGDIIEIAGYRLTFVHDVSAAFKEPASEQSAIVISAGTDNQHSHANRGREQIGDETVMLSAAEKSKLEKAKFQHANGNQSAAHETATITHRQDSSGYLEPVPGITGADPAAPSVTGPGESNVARQLFQLAFQLATADTIAAAANLTLHLVTETLGVDAGAVLLASDPSSVNQRLSIDQLQIISTRQDDDRSYRRVADVLAETVLGDGQAVLGRNLIDDDALSSADSRGTYSTANTVVAPIRIDGIVVGFLHVYGD